MSASLTEGFGLSLLESVSLGTPVITTRFKYGSEDIIKNQVNGFIVDSDEEFAQQIIRVLTDKELQNFLYENCLASVKKYSSNKISLKWKELFVQLYQNSLIQKKVYKNNRSSAYGNIFIQEHADQILNSDKIRVFNVDYSKSFKNKACTLLPGIYRIINIRTEDGLVIGFNIIVDEKEFKGSIPIGALDLEFL